MTTDASSTSHARKDFWGEIFALRGSVTPIIAWRVLVFTVIAIISLVLEYTIDPDLGARLGPYEVAGAILGILLVFRTNAGYDRWYEGRKMLGQIVNYSRNLAVTALAHGPADPAWRETTIRWIASYGHVTRATLRGQGVPPEVRRLLGDAWADELAAAPHMPTFVARRVGDLMRQGTEMGMDSLAFLEADRERSFLLEYEGACERIRNTPVPKAYSINLRRLIFLYLLFVPFALLDHLQGAEWLTPVIMVLVASAVLSMEQIAVELEQPFDESSLNHLPLDEITANIERELLQLAAMDQGKLAGQLAG